MVWGMLPASYNSVAWQNTIGDPLHLRNCVYRPASMDKAPGKGDPLCRSDCPGPESMWSFPPGSSEGFGVTGRKEVCSRASATICVFQGGLFRLCYHVYFGELLFPVQHIRPLICQLHSFWFLINVLHIDFAAAILVSLLKTVSEWEALCIHSLLQQTWLLHIGHCADPSGGHHRWNHCGLYLKNLIVH